MVQLPKQVPDDFNQEWPHGAKPGDPPITTVQAPPPARVQALNRIVAVYKAKSLPAGPIADLLYDLIEIMDLTD